MVEADWAPPSRFGDSQKPQTSGPGTTGQTPNPRPWHGPNPKHQALACGTCGPNPDRHTRPCVVKSPTHSPSTTRRRTSNRTPSTSEQRQGHIPGLTTFQCVRSPSTGSTTTHPCASVGVGRGGSEREPGGRWQFAAATEIPRNPQHNAAQRERTSYRTPSTSH